MIVTVMSETHVVHYTTYSFAVRIHNFKCQDIIFKKKC